MDQHAAGAPRSRSRPFRFGLIILVLITLFVFRVSVLRSIGYFLVDADRPARVDALYVLGGASFDRGTEAARLLGMGIAPVAYCTGSNVPQSYRAEGRIITEAELTRSAGLGLGADPRRLLPFPYGTSTFEEAAGVLHHARGISVDSIAVLTTEFHSRRVRKVFERRFDGTGIHVMVLQAASTEYDPDQWWTSEEGLLMVNNEYVKTIYYALKH